MPVRQCVIESWRSYAIRERSAEVASFSASPTSFVSRSAAFACCWRARAKFSSWTIHPPVALNGGVIVAPREVPVGRDHPAKDSAEFGHKQSTRDSSADRLEKARSDPDPFSLLVMLVSLPNLRIWNVFSGLTALVSQLIPSRPAHIRHPRYLSSP